MGTTTSESILASGRDVGAGCGKLGVLVSSRGFDGGHHLFHVVAQPGSGNCQAVLATGVAWSGAAAPSDQRGRPSSLRHSDFGTEAVGRVGNAVPLPALPVPE